jgi:cytoskeletal protein RodZ
LLSNLGELLKRARLEKGISIEELQETTKIRRRYIEAIEQGQFEALPGSFYARAFVKNLAEVLGLDPHQVLSQFESELPKTHSTSYETIRHSRVQAKMPSPAGRWFTKGLGYLFVILIVSLTYYLVIQNVDDSGVDRNDAFEKGVDSDTTDEGENVDSPPPAAAPPTDSATPPAQEEKEEPKVEVVYNKTGTVGRSEADFYSVKNASDLVITLKALEDCWFILNRVDSNGEIVESLTLKKGESRNWTLQESAWLRLGNPRGVEMTINGHPIRTSDVKRAKGYQLELVSKTQ